VEDLENADLTDCIKRLHKPLMVLHSPTDNTVGIENASTIFQTARHPRSFVSLEGSDHLLTGKGQAARAAKIIAAWADQYLDAGR
jgi:esterase/lipase